MPGKPPGAAALAEPTRTCVGCRRRTSAGELVRLTALDGGWLQLGNQSGGRGAWLCGSESDGRVPAERCLARAVAKGALARALRAPVRPDAAGGIRLSDGAA